MATRAEVARLAGVSPATVSYVISGKATISDATRVRVLQAMQELHYTPNMMAQALAGRRSRIVAMLFPSQERGISNADMEYVLGAASAARELDHHLLLWPTADRDVDEVCALGQAGLLDGVILMEVRMQDERLDLLREAAIPVALIGRTSETNPTEPYADRDFEGAISTAVEHLALHGHRHLAFVNAPRRALKQGFGATVRADAAFRGAVKAFGLQGTRFYCDPTIEAGRALFRKLRTAHPEITGIVEMNPEAVIGIMHEAQRLRVGVPKDVSVVSVGVSDPFAHATVPALTTVAPPAHAMGRVAARLLIATVTGSELPDDPRLLAGTLVERESCGPVPSAPGPHVRRTPARDA